MNNQGKYDLHRECFDFQSAYRLLWSRAEFIAHEQRLVAQKLQGELEELGHG